MADVMRIFVPSDTTALSRGADEVAALLQAELGRKGLDLPIVRNGSRGAFWLEPLVEIETSSGRIGFGPVRPKDVPELLAQGLLSANTQHESCIGDPEQLPWFAQQQRLLFARAGRIDPLSLSDYRAQGGMVGLQAALACSAQAIVDEVQASGLRGRGGAAFPAGIKWQTVLDADPHRPKQPQSGQKFIVCNADEGDSGTFADRLVMEADPMLLIEGMIIAGLAVGAEYGFIYLRSEYPVAEQRLYDAMAVLRASGWLGANINGSGRAFDLEVRMGSGAYICGEETSLLESLEGKRGMVRAKPPLPALQGAFGQPTAVNNVLTLASVPWILAHGGAAYAAYGQGRSLGTLPFQLAGNIRRGGVVEMAFGPSLRVLLDDFGGGTRSGRPAYAIQVGGPLGAYLPNSQWDTPLDYEAFTEVSAVLGHGGVVVFDDTVDMAQQARFAMEFCRVESCGKCTPCRIGAVRGVEVIDRIIANENTEKNQQLLVDLCETMELGSLCAMGGMTPNPVRSVMTHFSSALSVQPKAQEVLS